MSLYFQFLSGNAFMPINSKYNTAILWKRNKGSDPKAACLDHLWYQGALITQWNINVLWGNGSFLSGAGGGEACPQSKNISFLSQLHSLLSSWTSLHPAAMDQAHRLGNTPRQMKSKIAANCDKLQLLSLTRLWMSQLSFSRVTAQDDEAALPCSPVLPFTFLKL